MNQLSKEIQDLIKQEAAQEFETKGYNNWEADRMSARREGYKLGAAKWALMLEEVGRKIYAKSFEAITSGIRHEAVNLEVIKKIFKEYGIDIVPEHPF